jgi:hypothetical protein
MLIDLSDDSRNAPDSIRFNRESDSDEINESDSHAEKHYDSRISTFRGIARDSSNDNENASD